VTTAAQPVLLEGEPNGSARIIATVLNEKLAESPWKVAALGGIGKVVVCIETADRNEKTMIHKLPGGFAVRSDEPSADVVISLPMKLIPKVLRIPQGPARLPAMWKGGGLDLTKLLLRRQITVKGLFRHPLAAVRVLQVLSVPPGTVKKSPTGKSPTGKSPTGKKEN
jgi:hypothetical protein